MDSIVASKPRALVPRPFVAVVLLLVFKSSVLAQHIPVVEVSAGYTSLRDDIFDDFWPGWVSSLTANYNGLLGFSAQASGTYKQGTNLLFSQRCYLAGPRLSARNVSLAVPFAHFLAGACHISAAGLGLDATTTEPGIQAGGGLDLWVYRRLAIRMGADYVRMFLDGGNSDNFRAQLGVVIGLGTR